MVINLGDVSIVLEKSESRLNDVFVGGKRKSSQVASTLNCIFKKGFKNGSGYKEVKNFYFGYKEDIGLVFRAGMTHAPKEMIDYMEFLKSEYLELKSITCDIPIEDFLAHLVFKRRSQIISDVIKN